MEKAQRAFERGSKGEWKRTGGCLEKVQQRSGRHLEEVQRVIVRYPKGEWNWKRSGMCK